MDDSVNKSEQNVPDGDLISRKAAIGAICTRDRFGADERCRVVRWREGLEPYIHLRDVVTAIVNLPSAQPGQTNCEYCHEDSDGYVKPVEKNCHAFIRFGMDGWELSLKANGWHGSAKIRYCPMCGRDLFVK